jgi:hypothetical protein
MLKTPFTVHYPGNSHCLLYFNTFAKKKKLELTKVAYLCQNVQNGMWRNYSYLTSRTHISLHCVLGKSSWWTPYLLCPVIWSSARWTQFVQGMYGWSLETVIAWTLTSLVTTEMRQWAGLTQFVQDKYGWISEREAWKCSGADAVAMEFHLQLISE